MAAFAAAVKIDAFAYLPVQDFGNAFSIFVSQNYGAGRKDRIRQGIRVAAATSVCFGVVLSALVFVFAEPFMALFIDASSGQAVIAAGVRYLHIEGAFYALIGVLFLLYGALPRAGPPGHVGCADRDLARFAGRAGLRPSRPLPGVGVVGIWWSVPIGWALADAFGIAYFVVKRKKLV